MIGAMRGLSMVQHMMKNMILSCCPTVLCKFGQKLDTKNGEFLSYFYPFFYIQYRFLWSEGEPQVSIRACKNYSDRFQQLGSCGEDKKGFRLGLMKQKSCQFGLGYFCMY